jgi:hypothetical protein
VELVAVVLAELMALVVRAAQQIQAAVQAVIQ